MPKHVEPRIAWAGTSLWTVVLWLSILGWWSLACRADPPSKSGVVAGRADSAEFKLVTELYGFRKSPEARSELLARNGTAYQFIDEVPEEVIVIEPGRRRVELLNLRRSVRTVLTAQRLDAAVARLHRQLTADVDRQTRSDERRERVEAEIGRDVADPKFTESYEPKAHRLRLSNPTVEVVAVGEPDPDPSRLDIVINSLAATAKLTALRDPDGLPPFVRLETLRLLSAGRRLRPTEITFLYRLGGKPTKVRWTHRLIPSLTDRDREALSRVEARLETARRVEYSEYDRPEVFAPGGEP